MIVREIPGERLCFEVRSPRVGSTWKRVDLEAFDGAGQCSCEHHCCRCAPKLRGRASAPKADRRKMLPIECKHVAAAREHWSRRMLWGIVDAVEASRPKGQRSPHNEHE